MKPTIICLTPVKNEAWILDRFLSAASIWADYIIIADQMSTDGSREIALNYPKVKLIHNKSKVFNELERKRILINEARKIEGRRLLITLDADEIFSPEIFECNEWNEILKLKPGTAIDFQWANLLPDFKNMWLGYYFPWGYMDDGNELYDKDLDVDAIHCARVPINENTYHFQAQSIKVMHFQYTNWNRMIHKHYYYQCLEVIKDTDKLAIDIYRQYHHMFSIKNEEIVNLPANWIKYYNIIDICLDSEIENDLFWFDNEITNFFEKFGTKFFRKIAIWDVDWNKKAQVLGKRIPFSLKDPRNITDKLIHKWLNFSQNKLEYKIVRRIDRLIKVLLKY